MLQLVYEESRKLNDSVKKIEGEVRSLKKDLALLKDTRDQLIVQALTADESSDDEIRVGDIVAFMDDTKTKGKVTKVTLHSLYVKVNG